MYDVGIIGGGAAGFYAAIRIAELRPKASIVILEKTTKLLTKVKVSGGGRCNVTHNQFTPKGLASHYPRGERALRNLFQIHQAADVVSWFEQNDVSLKAEPDGRMFPITDDSQTIINLFMRLTSRYGVKIQMGKNVEGVVRIGSRFDIQCADGSSTAAKQVLVTTGGHPQAAAYDWLVRLGHSLRRPIPSLFTFNDSSKEFTSLMGVSVPRGFVRIEGTKFSQAGPVLITHWGLSGPAVIKLSAWAAEYLHDAQYVFSVLVSWVGDLAEDHLRETLLGAKERFGKRVVVNHPLFELPSRLWEKLCEHAGIDNNKVWGELPLKSVNKLLEALLRCRFLIRGKTTFKEEFVTCGGIPLDEVNLTRMESTKVPALYFAGEVLNIDGETGGFNFQAAWTTAFVAATAIAGQ